MRTDDEDCDIDFVNLIVLNRKYLHCICACVAKEIFMIGHVTLKHVFLFIAEDALHVFYFSNCRNIF